MSKILDFFKSKKEWEESEPVAPTLKIRNEFRNINKKLDVYPNCGEIRIQYRYAKTSDKYIDFTVEEAGMLRDWLIENLK